MYWQSLDFLAHSNKYLQLIPHYFYVLLTELKGQDLILFHPGFSRHWYFHHCLPLQIHFNNHQQNLAILGKILLHLWRKKDQYMFLLLKNLDFCLNILLLVLAYHLNWGPTNNGNLNSNPFSDPLFYLYIWQYPFIDN